MSVLTDLIYGGSHAVAGLTEGAVNDAIAKYGADHPIAFPDTAYFFPTIYAATGVKVKTLGDLPACVGVLKSLITDQEDLGQALNAGLATAVGAEIIEGLKMCIRDSSATGSRPSATRASGCRSTWASCRSSTRLRPSTWPSACLLYTSPFRRAWCIPPCQGRSAQRRSWVRS